MYGNTYNKGNFYFSSAKTLETGTELLILLFWTLHIPWYSITGDVYLPLPPSFFSNLTQIHMQAILCNRHHKTSTVLQDNRRCRPCLLSLVWQENSQISDSTGQLSEAAEATGKKDSGTGELNSPDYARNR